MTVEDILQTVDFAAEYKTKFNTPAVEAEATLQRVAGMVDGGNKVAIPGRKHMAYVTVSGIKYRKINSK